MAARVLHREEAVNILRSGEHTSAALCHCIGSCVCSETVIEGTHHPWKMAVTLGASGVRAETGGAGAGIGAGGVLGASLRQ
jgi:hypothetical protein